MFRSYPTPLPKKCLEHPTVPIQSTIFGEKNGREKGEREGVRGRARRFRTGVEEGDSEGQGQQQQDGVEKGG